MKKILNLFCFFTLILMISILFSDSAKAARGGKRGSITTQPFCPSGAAMSYKQCERQEPVCAWDGLDTKVGTCHETASPPEGARACSTINSSAECQYRMDCKYHYPTNLWDEGYCYDNPYYNKEVDEANKSSGTTPTNATDVDDIVKPASKKFTCKDVKELTGIWLLIRVLAPFLVILFGSLDYLKATMAGDEKKMKEASGRFPKRLIAFVLLILLPFLIQFIFNYIGTYGSQNSCLIKCIVNNDTSSKGCE